MTNQSTTDQVVAACAKHGIKSFVIPTDIAAWRAAEHTDEESVALDGADVILYARTNGDLCAFVGEFHGEVFKPHRLEKLFLTLDAARDRDAILLALRGIE